MFTGLDATKYPTNSKFNYGPIYSSNDNLNFNWKPDVAFATGPVIFNKPNKPYHQIINLILMYLFMINNANPIKIPLIIVFNI